MPRPASAVLMLKPRLPRIASTPTPKITALRMRSPSSMSDPVPACPRARARLRTRRSDQRTTRHAIQVALTMSAIDVSLKIVVPRQQRRCRGSAAKDLIERECRSAARPGAETERQFANIQLAAAPRPPAQGNFQHDQREPAQTPRRRATPAAEPATATGHARELMLHQHARKSWSRPGALRPDRRVRELWPECRKKSARFCRRSGLITRTSSRSSSTSPDDMVPSLCRPSGTPSCGMFLRAG